jgi:catechol 2,3-dioxygenase-like lactoylglutathione lyase family enzyme
MIGYVTLGSNDLEKARGFYGALLPTIGAKELMKMDSGFTMYGTKFGTPCIAVTKAHDQKAATSGNGTMVALAVESRAKVDELYAKAIALGAKDEGKPGLRGAEGPQAFYGAYFRDLDGNKLCAFKSGPK